MKINGVKGIEAVIVDQNMSKIETEHILKKGKDGNLLKINNKKTKSQFIGISSPCCFCRTFSSTRLFCTSICR